ncbi:MAG: DNA repair protein RecO [Verrucomicrobiae bacterium]|nr:DNA repair protein RecO [Verrucomicrobiae bacterium]
MEERATGIVVRVRPLTESSLIVHWLTEEAGRVATVAKGARRARSPYRGRLDLFHEAAFTFRRSRRSELHGLGEVTLRTVFPQLRTDWSRLAQAAYGVLLIEKTTETDTPLPGTWGLFRAYLVHLERAAVSPLAVWSLELRHLAESGLLPGWEGGGLPESSGQLAESLLEAEWGDWPEGMPEEGVWRPLDRWLRRVLGEGVGAVPKGRAEALGLSGAIRAS